MKIYLICDNTSYDKKWTTAVSIHSSSRLINWFCPDCGATTCYPTGEFEVTVEGGISYPDLLSCGSYPFMIVSSKVVASWQQLGIGPFVKFSVGVKKSIESTLSPRDAPQYYRVEFVGEIMVDIPNSGGRFTKFCQGCGSFMTEPMLLKKFAFRPCSWDGTPIFRDKRLFPRVLFCTDLVKQISETEQHSNFRFEEMMEINEN